MITEGFNTQTANTHVLCEWYSGHSCPFRQRYFAVMEVETLLSFDSVFFYNFD